jgi:hypothetical protein
MITIEPLNQQFTPDGQAHAVITKILTLPQTGNASPTA